MSDTEARGGYLLTIGRMPALALPFGCSVMHLIVGARASDMEKTIKQAFSVQLITAQRFREQFFTSDSRPSVNSIRAWLDEGELPGMRIGRRYYVDLDALFSAESQNAAADALVEGVLNAG
ncbi:helix-turn-helix domain-containing protein [Salinisphaera orenii]|uniref:helix-turn-helix domain-containing protein n=1 Tax=Salinisphaera orenii TaxID=856731 RepID=UPI000DBE85B0